jgi:hypothetical protein
MMGLYGHEQRGSGNPLMIFVTIGHLVLHRMRLG